MDGRSFDNLLRSLTKSRRSLVGSALAAGGIVAGLTSTDAKKKKKCARRCKDGCCTSKTGKCIKPAQQTSTQCGTGGEICRNNCAGSGSCKDGCDTCCAGDECVDIEQTGPQQCGMGGVACFACADGQGCLGGECCALKGSACGSNGVECCFKFNHACGPNNICCSTNGGSCDQDSDCCDAEDVCDGGTCLRKIGETCGGPGNLLCQSDLDCHITTLTCGPRDCTNPCAEQERCSEQVCTGVLNCCTQATFEECNGSEDFCGCITEGGECTRILL